MSFSDTLPLGNVHFNHNSPIKRVYFLSYHRAPYSWVIVRFIQTVAQLFLCCLTVKKTFRSLGPFCVDSDFFPSMSTWVSCHIRTCKMDWRLYNTCRYDWSWHLLCVSIFAWWLTDNFSKVFHCLRPIVLYRKEVVTVSRQKWKWFSVCDFLKPKTSKPGIWNKLIFFTRLETAPLCLATQWRDLYFTLQCNHLNRPAWGHSWAELSRK